MSSANKNVPPVVKGFNTAAEAPACPFSLFGEWLEEARASEPYNADAMAFATVDKDTLMPQCRMLLMKECSAEKGLVFFTNTISRKGQCLDTLPKAAATFYWKTTGRQVRFEGDVVTLPTQVADDYFATRPRISQIGAWTSKQSHPVASREQLMKEFDETKKRFGQGGDTQSVPRPPTWNGYALLPIRAEFWHEGEGRLHNRLFYERKGNEETKWDKMLMYP